MSYRTVRVLLDTNVWRYIVDHKAWPDLLRVSRTEHLRILIAPSVLYEALRTQNSEVRHGLARVMTLTRWQRLMPEAFTECQEVISEIRRVRAEWLRPTPDKNMQMRHRYDWTRSRGGFWSRVRDNPDMVAKHIADMDRGMLDRARAESQDRRREFRGSSWSEGVPLSTICSRPLSPVPGWRGDDVEAWRFDSWSSMTSARQVTDHPYSDWMSPIVDLSRPILDNVSWLQFWFYDVEMKKMPRLWLRWAVQFMQRFRRVTDGTPCDAQLATYLPDADVVVSADKALLHIVDKCRPYAPCPLPGTLLIPAGADGVAILLRALSSDLGAM
jgi:hypothetical protein